MCGGMKRLKSGMGVVKCNVVMLSPRGYVLPSLFILIELNDRMKDMVTRKVVLP